MSYFDILAIWLLVTIVAFVGLLIITIYIPSMYPRKISVNERTRRHILERRRLKNNAM